MSLSTYNRRSIKERLVKGGSWSVVGKGVSGVAMIGIVAILARILSPEDIGAYFLGLSIVFVSSIVSRLGLDLGVVKLIAEAIAQKQGNRTYSIIIKSIIITILTSTFIGLLLWFVFGPWLDISLFGSKSLQSVIGLIAIWVIFSALQGLFSEIFRAFHDIQLAIYFGGTIFGGLISIGAHLIAFLLIWLTHSQITLLSVVYISIAANLLGLLLAIPHLRNKLGSLDTNFEEPICIRDILSVSLPLWVTNISLMALTQVDIWIVGAFRSEKEVAIYGATTRIVKFVLMSQYVVNDVVAPIIAELNSRGIQQKLENTLRVTATFSALVALPIIGVLVAFNSQVMGFVYGTFYSSGGTMLEDIH